MATFDGLMVQWVADPAAPVKPSELLGTLGAALAAAAPDAPAS